MRNLFLLALLAFSVLPVSAPHAAAAMVDINTATAAQLDVLPGIGPAKAAAIIDYRTAHGPFARIEDIQNVKGIGPSTFAGFKAQITVGDVAASAPAGQPSASSVSSHTKQAASAPAGYERASLTLTKVSEPPHAQEVSAPSTTNDLAALGAAVSAPPAASGSGSLLHSPWTLAFLGILMLAGGAFMIL